MNRVDEEVMSNILSEKVFSGVALALTIVGSLMYYGERVNTLETKVDAIEGSDRVKDALLVDTLNKLNDGITMLNVSLARMDERLKNLEKGEP